MGKKEGGSRKRNYLETKVEEKEVQETIETAGVDG